MALTPNEQDFILFLAGLLGGFGVYAAYAPPPSIPSPYQWVVPVILWILAASSFALQYALGVEYPTQTSSTPATIAASASTTIATKLFNLMKQHVNFIPRFSKS